MMCVVVVVVVVFCKAREDLLCNRFAAATHSWGSGV